MCNVRLVLHRFAGFNYSQGYIFSKICQRCVYKTCGSKRKRKEGQRGYLEGDFVQCAVGFAQIRRVQLQPGIYISPKYAKGEVYKAWGSKRKRKEGQMGNLEGEKRKGRKKRKKQRFIIFLPKYYQCTKFIFTNSALSRTNFRRKMNFQRERGVEELGQKT